MTRWERVWDAILLGLLYIWFYVVKFLDALEMYVTPGNKLPWRTCWARGAEKPPRRGWPE